MHADNDTPTSWGSPVIRLVGLTIVALLLGIATARADVPGELTLTGDTDPQEGCSEQIASFDEGPKRTYLEALCALQVGGYDTFWTYLPVEGVIEVKTIDLTYDANPTRFENTRFDQAITFDEWSEQVRPILSAFILSDEGLTRWYYEEPTLPVCTDAGRCEQSTPEGRLVVQFGESEGRIELRLLQAEWHEPYYEEGCSL